MPGMIEHELDRIAISVDCSVDRLIRDALVQQKKYTSCIYGLLITCY